MHSSNMSGERPHRAWSYGSGSSSMGRFCSDFLTSASAARIAARSSSDGSGVISTFTTFNPKVEGRRGRWANRVGRRISVISCLALLACSGAAHAGTRTPDSWATPQIRAVTSAGLMGAKDVQTFRAGDALTAQALENLVFDLKARLSPQPEAGDPGNEPGAPVGPPTAPNPTVPLPTVTVTTPVTTTATTTTTTTATPVPTPPPA